MNNSCIHRKICGEYEKVYIWKQDEWPHFIWDDAALSYKLGCVQALQGKFVEKMSLLGFDLKNETILNTLTSDIYRRAMKGGEVLFSDQKSYY